MKKTLINLILLFMTLSLAAQNTNEEKSKLNVITSQKGVMIKFIESSLPILNLRYGEKATIKVRKYISKETQTFFLNIANSSASTSIPEEDLVAIIEALKTLKISLESDLSKSKDYLENKFVTNEGIQIGYYINNGNENWFLKLSDYGSNNTLLIKEFSDLESLLKDANSKIQEMKI